MGFSDSSFRIIRAEVAGVMCESSTQGVFPIASRILLDCGIVDMLEENRPDLCSASLGLFFHNRDRSKIVRVVRRFGDVRCIEKPAKSE